MNKSAVQKDVWKFLEAFREALIKKCGSRIDFIIVYGSAVRGEFVPGKSDVDTVIQVFEEKDKASVEAMATEIFWQVAKRHSSLKFQESLSVAPSPSSNNSLEKALKKVEKSAFLYVPVFVFSKGEIDWVKGTLHSKNPVVVLGQQLLIPQRSVFLRFKQEGVLLHGRDIRKEIAIRLTVLDRIRLGVAPQILAEFACLFAFFIPRKAQNYAVKALLYEVDGLLSTLNAYRRMERSAKIKKTEKLLLTQFTEQLSSLLHLELDARKGWLKPFDFELFHRAIRLKWGEEQLATRWATFVFCWKASWLIFRMNLRAMGALLVRRVQRKS